jgi:hypothetical protein
MARKTKPTSSQICSQRITAKHPAETAEQILEQLPQVWESDAQHAVVRTVIETALPPPRPDNILRSATILRVSRVIDKNHHRLVWRYVAANRGKFQKFKNRPKETEYPIFFTMCRLYIEGRNHNKQGVEAVRLVTKLAKKLAPRTKFSGEMYYRHILALRDTTISYWKNDKSEKSK